jgi:hypothetical protein
MTTIHKVESSTFLSIFGVLFVLAIILTTPVGSSVKSVKTDDLPTANYCVFTLSADERLLFVTIQPDPLPGRGKRDLFDNIPIASSWKEGYLNHYSCF